MHTHRSPRFYFLLALGFLLSTSLWGQLPTNEQQNVWEQFLEAHLLAEELEEGEEEHRYCLTLDALEALLSDPIDLNRADRTTLLGFPFLSAAQVDSLLHYRAKIGHFTSMGELMLIKNIGFIERKWLSLFAQTLPPSPETLSLRQLWLGGRHTIEGRIEIPAMRPVGFTDPTPEKHFLGLGFAHTLRYRFQMSNRLRYGLTLQNDLGEPFAAWRNRPYDFVSAHLVVGAPNSRRQWWVGDFRPTFAQGLLIGSLGLHTHDLSLAAPRLAPTRIRPHTSADEGHFYRGVAMRQRWGRWEMVAFAAHRAHDARLENDTARSLLYDGRHRNYRELQHRQTLAISTFGAHAEWRNKRGFIGASAYFQHFGRPISPTPRPYNRHYFRDRQAKGVGIDYGFQSSHWTLVGEIATDLVRHWATTHRAHLLLPHDWQLGAQFRVLATAFQAPSGATLQRGSRNQNELGATLSAAKRWPNKLETRGFIDIFRFPSASYRADTASNGCVAQVEMQWSAKATQHRLRYRFSTRQYNIKGYAPLLEYRTTHHLQWVATRTYGLWEAQATAAVSLHHRQVRLAPSWGALAVLRVSYRPSPSWRHQLALVGFRTDDFDTRIYAYQPQLPGMMSFPMFYGKGFSATLQAQWKPSPRWQCGLRLRHLHYLDRSAIGTGLDQITAPWRLDAACYAQFTF